MILLSRAVNVGLRLLGKETGLFIPIADSANDEKRNFTVESLVVSFFGMAIGYSYLFHTDAVDTGLKKGLETLCSFNNDELKLFETVRAGHTLYETDPSRLGKDINCQINKSI